MHSVKSGDIFLRGKEMVEHFGGEFLSKDIYMAMASLGINGLFVCK